MTARDDFLHEVLPRLHHTETALHDGDAGPRIEMWSHDDPVTLFGAAITGKGWGEVGAVFEHIAARFANCASCEWEVVAADADERLAYIVAIERTTTSVGGSEPSPYSLRSTTIFRREDGEWKPVHRHADPYDDQAAPLLTRLT
jgi:ketosteroid isomerase-like protein